MSPEPSRSQLRAPFREALRRAWTRLRGGEVTAARAASSVALGLFVGTLPLPGTHIFLVLAVSVPLRLDAAVAYAAANISIPPVAPFLWLAAVQLGHRLLHGSFVALSADGARDLVRHGGGSLIGALALGSIVLASVLSAIGFAATWGLVRARLRRRMRESEPDLEAAIERTARRYERCARSRGTYYYVRGKLRADPATRAVARLAPLGRVLDLGCGRGQLAVLLVEASRATHVVGVDWDERKIDLARASGDGLAVGFNVGDARDAAPGGQAAREFDTVLLVDVLHYFDVATQDAMLAHAASKIRDGGRLVVREADRGRGIRSWLTRTFERIGRAVRFNLGPSVVFRDVEREFVPTLERLGFRCVVEPCWAGTPFSNVLLVATRSGASGEHAPAK